MKQLLFCVVAGVLMSACEAPSVSEVNETFERTAEVAAATPAFSVEALETDLQTLMAHYNVPGLSFAVIEAGEIVHVSGLGIGNLSEAKVVDADTRFRAGSVTKQFAAALVGIAAHRTDLSLYDPITDHLPVEPGHALFTTPPIRVRDLLTHAAGFGNMDGSLVFFPVRDQADMLARLDHLSLISTPGDSFAYSNVGYTLAGMIAANALGAEDAFDDVLAEQILSPLNMSRSTMDLSVMEGDDNVAQGYAMSGEIAVPVEYEEMKAAGPSGGLNVTARDLAHWVKLWINDGQWGDRAILSAAFIEQASTTQFAGQPEDGQLFTPGYGLGFFVDPFEGTRRVSHGGNTSGFSTLVDFLPEKDIGLAILTNQQNSDVVYRAADLIYAHMLDLEKPIIAEIEPRITPAREITERSSESVDPASLSELIGVYENPGYGRLEVVSEEDGLIAQFPDFKLPLIYEEPDQFLLTWQPEVHQNIPTFEVTVLRDPDVAVEGLRIPLRLGDEIFERVAEQSD